MPDFIALDDALLGGVADGVADNYSAILAANAAGKTVLINGPYRIAQAVTVTVPVIFGNSGIIGPDNVTVTFAKDVSGPTKKIFNYVGTGKVVLSNKQESPAEWWGAEIGGAVDCQPPIMAGLASCSNIKLGTGLYACNSSITVGSYQKLSGDGWTNTTIRINGSTLDGIKMTPTTGYVAGNRATYIANPRIADFAITRNVNPNSPSTAFATTGPAGVRVLGCNGFEIEGVSSTDHYMGFYFGATNGGHINRPYTSRIAGSGSNQYIGYYFDGFSTNGTTGSPNSSIRVIDPVMADSTSGISSTGFYLNGHMADVWLFRPETSNAFNGIEIAGHTSRYVVDVHIVQPINDQFRNAGIYAHDTKNYGQINIAGGYGAPKSTASAPAVMYLNNCRGVHVTEKHQAIGWPKNNTIGLLMGSCDECSVDMAAQDCANPMKIYTSQQCQIGGQIYNPTITGTDGVFVSGTVRSSFNIAASGGLTNGYTLDNTSLRNEFNGTKVNLPVRINNNGTPITAAGLFGTNLAAGVMS